MTTEQLATIETRAGCATPGPWALKARDPTQIHRGTVQVEERGRAIETIAECYCGGYEGHGLPNAEFIAHARTDIPALVAEVRALMAALARETRLREHHEVEAAALAALHLAAVEERDKLLAAISAVFGGGTP